MRRWWYCLIIAPAWNSSIGEVGSSGRKSKIMIAALSADVEASKFKVRWIRRVGSNGVIRKAGSFGQGRKSELIRSGFSDAISDIEGLRVVSLVGILDGVLS